ncbi:MAG TPA: cyclophilin-like fold protein [Chitinophagaceae bacterium]|nr:cyclophilin-like fold protein [Chitinophagaceae bacterium]
MKNANENAIQITLNNTKFLATLFNNKAASDFILLLPLTLTLTDYAATEKVSDLPKRLTTTDAPAGYKPSAGDITYYAPWGNLAIFYKGFGYAGGLVPLGKIINGIEHFKVAGSLQVTMELIAQ